MSTQQTALPVEMTDELQKAVAAATSPDAIRFAILAEAEKQAGVKADAEAVKTAAEKAAADKLAEDQRAAVGAQSFKRIVQINGRDFEFEAGSETELTQMIVNAYQLAESLRPEPTTPQTQQVDPAIAAKAAADKATADALAKTELESQFRLGKIPVDQYLRESGAMDNYLASQGISVADLKATVEASQSTQYEKSWAQATEEFLHDAGNDWPGGDQNREILGMKLVALGLTDADDKVNALRKAYAAMKESSLVFTPTTAATTTSSAVVTPQQQVQQKSNAEIAAEQAAAAAAATIAAQRFAAPIPSVSRATSSSLFGASSGTMPASGAASAASAAKVDIPANATPAEILEAWKASQIAAGVNPNDAFMDTFRNKR